VIDQYSGDLMGDVTKAIVFPEELWLRVVERASSGIGVACRINGKDGRMCYMNPGYLVTVLVKRALDELDAEVVCVECKKRLCECG